MLSLKTIALLSLAGSSIVAGSAIAYYYGFALPKKDKEVLALQVAKLSVTPTPTLTPTPTASPTATPTIVFRYIPPTSTSTPTAPPAPTTDIKKTLNDYNACKQACPIVGSGVTCTQNSDNTSTCHSNSHPDQACIDSCKSKYGLNF
jgi:hypothetical protein